MVQEAGKEKNSCMIGSAIQHLDTESTHFAQTMNTYLVFLLNIFPVILLSLANEPHSIHFPHPLFLFIYGGSIVNGHGITTSGYPSSKPSG